MAQGCFNTQPPEGGCSKAAFLFGFHVVSTHSRPKAADIPLSRKNQLGNVSTHSRPKAAARFKNAV